MDDEPPRSGSIEPRIDDYRQSVARNPFGGDSQLVVQNAAGALANAEQQRSIAEVQARMIIARSNPRNQMRCMDAILQDCMRPAMAQSAIYQYARGGSSISGPSIRLAETIARRWGNIASGIKEVSRANGYSECVAYAWDLETGYYDERQFQVRHWRDTRSGGHPLTDERDIYELIANMGQRRKRAVLLTVIPGDVVEAALEACEDTLRASVDVTPEGLKRLAEAFAAFGVTRAQLEKRCQRRLETIHPAQVVALRKIYASLKDDMSTPAEWFGENAWTDIQDRHNETAAGEAAKKAAAKPANDPKPATARKAADKPAEDKPPAAAKAAAPEQTTPPAATTAASPPADDDDGFPGKVTPKPDAAAPATAAPAAQQQPKAEPQATTTDFDAWLLDENGEAVGDDAWTDPVAYASRLEAMWMKHPNKDAIVAQNADGMDAAAAASPAAAVIIKSLRATEEEATQQEIAEAGGAVEPEPVVVPLAMERGKPAVGSYLKTFKTEVDLLTAETFLPFMAANWPTVTTVPLSTRSLLIKAMLTKAKALGITPPAELAAALTAPAAAAPAATAPPAEDKPDPDIRSVDHRIDEMRMTTNEHELNHWSGSTLVQTFTARLRADPAKKHLMDKLSAAYLEHQQKVKATAGQPPA